MKLKTLLLGSAAAFVVAGGAQAADLSIAEPVDYVRVCDAFGTGYWYIPGTDTCLKIGGKVQFDVKFRRDGWGDYYNGYTVGSSTGAFVTVTDTSGSIALGSWYSFTNSGYTVFPSGHSSDWKFVTEASVNFTASSMTEYGLLKAYLNLKGVYDHWDGKGGEVSLDGAYLSLGHLTFGHTDSPSNLSNGYADAAWRPDHTQNLIMLSWAAAGFGIQLGIEDPYKRWGTELPVYYDAVHMPDITGNITVSQDHWNAKLVAAYGEMDFGSVYMIGGTVEAKMDMFSILVGGAFGTGDRFLGTQDLWNNGAEQWSAWISGKFQATPTLSIAGSYAISGVEYTSTTATAGGAKLVWSPVPGFEAYAEGMAWKFSNEDEHDWSGKVGVARSF